MDECTKNGHRFHPPGTPQGFKYPASRLTDLNHVLPLTAISVRTIPFHSLLGMLDCTCSPDISIYLPSVHVQIASGTLLNPCPSIQQLPFTPDVARNPRRKSLGDS
jgi:hypothetical protein